MAFAIIVAAEASVVSPAISKMEVVRNCRLCENAHVNVFILTLISTRSYYSRILP